MGGVYLFAAACLLSVAKNPDVILRCAQDDIVFGLAKSRVSAALDLRRMERFKVRARFCAEASASH
jgi:hypothetical protein